MAQAETCGFCRAEVPPGQAREVRTALEHMRTDQRREFHDIYSMSVPALLCAGCFLPVLGDINRRLFERSPDAPSPL
jgi:hypothetical protein